MSFAGHVLDMIQRARNNSALLGSKKARIRRVKEAHVDAKVKNSLADNDIKLSPQEWEIYKQELKVKLKQQRSNEIYLILLLVLIILIVGGFVIWLLLYF